MKIMMKKLLPFLLLAPAPVMATDPIVLFAIGEASFLGFIIDLIAHTVNGSEMLIAALVLALVGLAWTLLDMMRLDFSRFIIGIITLSMVTVALSIKDDVIVRPLNLSSDISVSAGDYRIDDVPTLIVAPVAFISNLFLGFSRLIENAAAQRLGIDSSLLISGGGQLTAFPKALWAATNFQLPNGNLKNALEAYLDNCFSYRLTLMRPEHHIPSAQVYGNQNLLQLLSATPADGYFYESVDINTGRYATNTCHSQKPQIITALEELKNSGDLSQIFSRVDVGIAGVFQSGLTYLNPAATNRQNDLLLQQALGNALHQVAADNRRRATSLNFHHDSYIASQALASKIAQGKIDTSVFHNVIGSLYTITLAITIIMGIFIIPMMYIPVLGAKMLYGWILSLMSVNAIPVALIIVNLLGLIYTKIHFGDAISPTGIAVTDSLEIPDKVAEMITAFQWMGALSVALVLSFFGGIGKLGYNSFWGNASTGTTTGAGSDAALGRVDLGNTATGNSASINNQNLAYRVNTGNASPSVSAATGVDNIYGTGTDSLSVGGGEVTQTWQAHKQRLQAQAYQYQQQRTATKQSADAHVSTLNNSKEFSESTTANDGTLYTNTKTGSSVYTTKDGTSIVLSSQKSEDGSTVYKIDWDDEHNKKNEAAIKAQLTAHTNFGTPGIVNAISPVSVKASAKTSGETSGSSSSKESIKEQLGQGFTFKDSSGATVKTDSAADASFSINDADNIAKTKSTLDAFSSADKASASKQLTDTLSEIDSFTESSTKLDSVQEQLAFIEGINASGGVNPSNIKDVLAHLNEIGEGKPNNDKDGKPQPTLEQQVEGATTNPNDNPNDPLNANPTEQSLKIDEEQTDPLNNLDVSNRVRQQTGAVENDVTTEENALNAQDQAHAVKQARAHAANASNNARVLETTFANTVPDIAKQAARSAKGVQNARTVIGQVLGAPGEVASKVSGLAHLDDEQALQAKYEAALSKGAEVPNFDAAQQGTQTIAHAAPTASGEQRGTNKEDFAVGQYALSTINSDGDVQALYAVEQDNGEYALRAINDENAFVVPRQEHLANQTYSAQDLEDIGVKIDENSNLQTLHDKLPEQDRPAIGLHTPLSTDEQVQQQNAPRHPEVLKRNHDLANGAFNKDLINSANLAELYAIREGAVAKGDFTADGSQGYQDWYSSYQKLTESRIAELENDLNQSNVSGIALGDSEKLDYLPEERGIPEIEGGRFNGIVANQSGVRVVSPVGDANRPLTNDEQVQEQQNLLNPEVLARNHLYGNGETNVEAINNASLEELHALRNAAQQGNGATANGTAAGSINDSSTDGSGSAADGAGQQDWYQSYQVLVDTRIDELEAAKAR